MKKNQPRRRYGRISHRPPKSSCTLERFLAERSPAPEVALGLRTALPGHAVPKSSGWLAPGVTGARRATLLSDLQILDALEQLVAWTYERDADAQVDLAVHLAQIELLRRKRGAPPRTITLPSAAPGARLDETQVLGAIMQWEAFSYAQALARPREPRRSRMLLASSTLALMTHLARVDGVPVRPERLDPDALATALAESPAVIGEIARPDGYAPMILDGVADVYARCAARGYVYDDLAQRLRGRLRVLAAGFDRRAA